MDTEENVPTDWSGSASESDDNDNSPEKLTKSFSDLYENFDYVSRKLKLTLGEQENKTKVSSCWAGSVSVFAVSWGIFIENINMI